MFKRFSVGMLIIVLVLGVVGAAFAQDPPPPPDDGVCPYGETCGGHGMGGFGYQGTLPTILADALGMTSDELYAALDDGQTIAEIAADQGVELSDLVTALVAPHIEQLEQAVADGYMTREQADWMIGMMTAQMAWRLGSFDLGDGGYGGGGCGGMGMGMGMMGDGHHGGRHGGHMGGGRRG